MQSVETFDRSASVLDILKMFRRVCSDWNVQAILDNFRDSGMIECGNFGDADKGWQAFKMPSGVELFVRYEPKWIEVTSVLKQAPVDSNAKVGTMEAEFRNVFESTKNQIAETMGSPSIVNDIVLSDAIEGEAWIVENELLICLEMNQYDSNLPYCLSMSLRKVESG